jgi:uncharacterized protein (DUF2235 family)
VATVVLLVLGWGLGGLPMRAALWSARDYWRLRGAAFAVWLAGLTLLALLIGVALGLIADLVFRALAPAEPPGGGWRSAWRLGWVLAVLLMPVAVALSGARETLSRPRRYRGLVVGGARFEAPAPPLGPAPPRSGTGRRIVILCDGTGNEISENISNVLKLYRCLRKTEKTEPRQLVYYDPGVGTLARPDPWHKLKQDFNAILGLATGYGLDDNVLAAYGFLVANWHPGDQIYLFGFSRGAYTVRVLAGLIHKIGLITPEQVNLAGSGLIAYKQFSSDTPTQGLDLSTLTGAGGSEDDGPVPVNKFDNAAQFARITSSRAPTIHFVGVWDTVPAFGWVWDQLAIPNTSKNKIIRYARHALAIDERRRFFRTNRWSEDLGGDRPTDVRQVWFAGVHSDVGGGYPETGLSDIALAWMAARATDCGLALDFDAANVQLAPQPSGPMHDSMTWYYRMFGELVRPIPIQRRDDAGRPVVTNEKAADLTIVRLQDPAYRPPNLIAFRDAGGPQAKV